MPTLYTLRDIEKRIGSHPVLAVPSLELDTGGVTAIVGPNGSGKTTLLRLLAFVDKATRGTIELAAGVDPRRLLFVEQAPFLFRGTVESNVGYGLRARGVPRAERLRRLALTLEELGLGGLERRRVFLLSGGERRRVALARALVLSPEVLLLDEPFAEVDRVNADRVEAQLVARGEQGSVILTTHDLAQAHRIATRVLSLAGGRLSPIPLVNAFRGGVIVREGVFLFRASGIEFEVSEGHRDATVAAIDPEAIVISTEPLHSSARNRFPGTVTQVEARNGWLHLTVDCGARLVAAITAHSYADLDLNVGRSVWVTFKSTAVHLY